MDSKKPVNELRGDSSRLDAATTKNQNPPPFASLEGRLRHEGTEKIKTKVNRRVRRERRETGEKIALI
ncbi:MAG TPA: hypothetical protein VG759_07625 [Candidatus Angelobacter sp.]|jgi:hypothetical protein|nr:hypothetical protein [Candidatus Angelobacter sp.]